MNLNDFVDFVLSPDYEKKIVEKVKESLIRVIKIIIGLIPTMILYSISLHFTLELYDKFGFEKTLLMIILGVIVYGRRKDKK